MSPTRREFLRRVVASSILAATGVVAVWEFFEANPVGQPPSISILQTSQQTTVQQTSGERSSTSQSSTQGAPPGYFLVAPMGALNGMTSAYFTHPTQGTSLLLSLGGQWKAFSATCTHAPCTVQFSGSQIRCPCHGGTFDPSNGSVVSGPPPTKLPEFGVIIQNNSLYVSDAVVN